MNVCSKFEPDRFYNFWNTKNISKNKMVAARITMDDLNIIYLYKAVIVCRFVPRISRKGFQIYSLTIPRCLEWLKKNLRIIFLKIL